jgi:hypothetical protein
MLTVLIVLQALCFILVQTDFTQHTIFRVEYDSRIVLVSMIKITPFC